MAKLENVSIDALEAALEEVSGKRETQRLMVAILYKRGPSVPMIAEWFDMREQTIYEWFVRLEQRPIMDAITDDDRSGRPPKLDDTDRSTFEAAVHTPPSESGYDEPAWSTTLAQRFLREEFDVEYSQRHVQRLLIDAGLRHRSPQSHPAVDAKDERRRYWSPTDEVA